VATTAEEVEQVLVADWHEDQCDCSTFDGADLETCYSRNSDRYKYRSIPPMTWTVEDVLDAFDIVAARSSWGGEPHAL